ncbi:MAG TPA: hypothetical protein VLI67_01985 [Vicinamibacteria bacterium]|nr:hypothetical protein [Vicinamibacteria bacterium]
MCTRENPCGGILYEDPQVLELARAGIDRRVRKCLAGHTFWEGTMPSVVPDAAQSCRRCGGPIPAGYAASRFDQECGCDGDPVLTTAVPAARPRPRRVASATPRLPVFRGFRQRRLAS